MLSVRNLTKTYPTFTLKDVSFELQAGYIMGFIGMNGAGKSTTLKSILHLVHPDGGSVELFGRDMYQNEVELKQDIGFMLGPVDYYTHTRVRVLAGVYGRFYQNWDEAAFSGYLEKFHIDPQKRVAELSAGMKVKLGIALCLSHGAKLILLDEPTSGLDPVARDELLDLFQEIVQGGERSILFSTHITSDLDKCADYILFLKRGVIIANDTKDDLLAKHALVTGKPRDLSDELRARMVSCKTSPYSFTGLMLRENLKEADPVRIETPNLEDLMVYYDREDAQ